MLNRKKFAAFALSLIVTTVSTTGFQPQVKADEGYENMTPGTKITASASNFSIRLKKPAGVSNDDIKIIDQYSKRRLKINIKGKYKSYFKKSANRIIRRDKKFRSYSVTYSGGYTHIYIRPRKRIIKGYSVTQNSSFIYVKYDKTRKMYKNIVVLDAGHGGKDSGATGNGLREKNLTLAIVKAAKARFDKDHRYKVYYTRLSDSYPSLIARSKLANDTHADRFISVHINSGSKSARGTETLYNSKGYKSGSGLTSKKLGKVTHSYIRSATGFPNRGLKNRTRLSVLRHTKTASTLGEFGFISNKTEARLMKYNSYTYGRSIFNSTVKSFSKYPTRR